MATAEELDALLIKSLVLLEWRLKRLELVLGDRIDDGKGSSSASTSVLGRLDKLEKKWQKLARQEKVAGAMNEFYRTHQELFTPPKESNDPKDASPAPLAVQVSMLQSSSSQISEAASALSSLELPFPPTSSFTTLASLAPLMSAIEDRQVAHALEVSELRKRSMMAISRYKKVHVEGQRQVWKEWSSLLSSWEREVGRAESKRAKAQQ